jgi:ADP-glucose pyrophosphorylase
MALAMPLPRVLVLVLAGGAGSRLELLTERRAKAVVPFAAAYRLVDFPLSNCQHSQLADVWITMQFHPASLSEHLANGRPWDLDRTTGGLMTLAPYRGDEREGRHSGTADSVWRNADLIRRYRADALVVLSADAVYRLDYRAVVDAHLGSGAEVTLVTTEVDAADAGRYGVVSVGEGGSVRQYAYKPDEPEGTTVANEVFVLTPDAVLDRLGARSRTVSATRACRNSERTCCRRWRATARRGPTRSTAIGATWARSRRTGRRTLTSLPTSRRSTWTTRHGRSTPAPGSTPPRGSRGGRGWSGAWCRAGRGWPER